MQFPPLPRATTKAPGAALLALGPPTRRGVEVHGRFYRTACWTEDLRATERAQGRHILDLRV
ncbi:MAG: hypothetical protein V4820_09525 [Pseudomonadota bacterium]|uniref:hypothetical protein n=1 Tax=Phenylobacterium sp. TaxID=1871053 RepID=UPI00271F4873|nr:hypothetical protein [Phenylobacterium sp.]MDO9432357.1 hypothetical protein [Phenylobacterium sp.]